MPEFTVVSVKPDGSPSNKRIVRTVCCMCPAECGILAHVENERLVKVEGYRDHPVSKGFLCIKGRQIPQYVYSPGRLEYPQRKTSSGWKRITWDEAYDIIATKLANDKEKYGPSSLALVNGDSLGRAAYDNAHRFLDLYGCPTRCSPNDLCAGNSYLSAVVTFGRHAPGDVHMGAETKCLVMWAHNIHNSWPSWMDGMLSSLKHGAKLIVIDPKVTPFAKKADIHLQPRPGSDGALALAMINVIITEDLYDHEFVRDWAVGFDKLAEHIRQYTPEWAEPITWVKAEDIRKTARMYATTKPAALENGCKIETVANGFQTIRALNTLVAITGNLDKPGGHALASAKVKQKMARIPELAFKLKMTGTDKFPLQFQVGPNMIGYGIMVNWADLVLKGEPFLVRNVILEGCNAVVSWPDSAKVRRALDKVEFLVALDIFPTDSTQYADILLPICSPIEASNFAWVNFFKGVFGLRPKAIEPLFESRSDLTFWTQLAHKMGYQEYFPWKNDEECLDWYLEPSGRTIKSFMEDPVGFVVGAKYYDDYKKRPLRTPSGKVELYSSVLEEKGYPPLPTYREPGESPISTPELAKEYPLVCTAGARELEYWHARFRNLPNLKKRNPGPKATINPDTAAKYGVKDGDPVIVETKRGAIKVTANCTNDMMPGVVGVGHAWPEASENLLTSDMPDDPIAGYPNFSAMLCRIRKADADSESAGRSKQ